MISTTKTYLVEQIVLGNRVCIGAFVDEATACILAQRANRARHLPIGVGPELTAPHATLVTALRDMGGIIDSETGTVAGSFEVRKVSHICLPGQSRSK